MPERFKIEIQKPCNQDWSNFAKTKLGGFCGSCNKDVIDFTNFTESEIKAFYKSHPSEKICGKFLNHQLNKTFEIDSKSSHSSLLRIGAFLVGVYSFFSSQSLVAQNRPNGSSTTITKTKDSKAISKSKSKPKTSKPKYILISGQVKAMPILDITIELLGTPYKATTNLRGDFTFIVLEDILKNHCILEIKAPHSVTKQLYVNSCYPDLGLILLEMIPFEVTSYTSVEMGAVAIICLPSKPTFIQRIKTFFKKPFKVFNRVQSKN